MKEAAVKCILNAKPSCNPFAGKNPHKAERVFAACRRRRSVLAGVVPYGRDRFQRPLPSLELAVLTGRLVPGQTATPLGRRCC
jgi:hypothetical protein